MKSFSNRRWARATREALKEFGGCIFAGAIVVIAFFLWASVLHLASIGFFELCEPLGYIVLIVCIGLTIAVLVRWELSRSDRNHYITVKLRVTDEQRQALVDHLLALGYGEIYKGHQEKYKGHRTYTDSDLQFCMSNLLELELKERFPEMLARHAAWRASIMSEWQSKKQT